MAEYLKSTDVHLKYVVETTVGTRPTAGYKELEGIKSIPSMSPAPDSLDTTTLNEKEYKTSIPGLKDLGGALEFVFNMSQDLMNAWDTLMTSYEAAKATGKKTWFEVDVPGLEKALFFPGIPTAMGLPELTVNTVIESSNSITPIGEPVWETKSTTGA